MKHLLFFFLFLSSFCAKSQNYEKLVVEGAHWRLYSYGCYCNDGIPYPHYNAVSWYKIEGDTIVDNLAYKQLYLSVRSEVYYSESSRMYNCNPYQLVALLREDTINKKVYILDILPTACIPGNQPDTLLYDFSVQVGDTTTFNIPDNQDFGGGCISEDFVAVDSVDTVFMGYHRRAICYNPVNPAQTAYQGFMLIEGIGPSYGLSGCPAASFESVSSTTLEAYCMGVDQQCGIGCLLNGITETPASTFKVFPNPFCNSISISTNESVIEVQLRDVSGKLLQRALPQEITTELQTENLAPGYYYLSLQIKSGEIFSRPIVKINY